MKLSYYIDNAINWNLVCSKQVAQTIFVKELAQVLLVENDFYLERATGAGRDVLPLLEGVDVDSEFVAARTRVEKQVFAVDFFEVHVVDFDFVIDVFHLLILGGHHNWVLRRHY